MISTLSQLVAAVESSGNQWAVRFEPLHTPRPEFVSAMAAAAACSIDTARVLCSTSWGLYQIMGDELMALGLKMSPIQYCASVQSQNDLFPKFLAQKGIAGITLESVVSDSSVRANFARLYNGPGNINGYSQRLLDVYQKASSQ